MDSTFTQALLAEAQQNLPPKKFLHTLGVTHAAVALAEIHGANVEHAAIAGLVHDRSKAMKPEEIEADLERRGVEIGADDRPFPAIWHGLHAATWLRQDAEMADTNATETIACAVEVHSTADAGMSDLAKILFIADYTEPSRSFEGLDAIRATARRDLAEGFRACLESKCRYMAGRGQRVSPRAARALEEMGIEIQSTETAGA